MFRYVKIVRVKETEKVVKNVKGKGEGNAAGNSNRYESRKQSGRIKSTVICYIGFWCYWGFFLSAV